MASRSNASVAGGAIAALIGLFPIAPAEAQFYKDKTLTLLINYGAGGNADIEARVFQQHLKKHIPGTPNVIIQNQPGAGGINAMNMLGLNVGSRADGLTLGYFTFGPISSIAEDPNLKINVADFMVVGASKSAALVYGRKDIPPGMTKPTDLVKATKLFVAGYARSSLHDTRLKMAFELLDIPFTMVTGFQSTGAVNKAMAQGEVNITGSTLPGYQTQAVPQIVNLGIGMPFFQFPIYGADGKPAGNPMLSRQGIPTFDQFYAQAKNKPLAGPKWEAMLLANHLGTQMQRLIVLPKGSPVEARDALRAAFQDTAKDPDFIRDFERVTNEKPEIAPASEVEPLLERMRNVDPMVRKVLKEAIAE